MEITPRELRDTEIHSEMRGYSRDEVNDLLERAAVAIEASNQRVTQLQDRLTSAQGEAVRTRETEDILHRTLLLAQRAADEAVAEATAKSRQMLDEADMSSRRLVADAEAEARRKGEAERRRLEHEIVELAGRRDALLADVEALSRFEAEYRERMVRTLETDLSALRTRPTTAPTPVPETSDVEIPVTVAPDAPGETGDPFATPTAARSADVSPADVAASDASHAGGSNGDGANVANAEPVEAEMTDADDGDPARGPQQLAAQPIVRPRPDDASGNATSEVDVRTLFEQTAHASREESVEQPREQAGEVHAVNEPASGVARAAGLRPIDLAGSENDGDILDDDAFFATLRDAVHDEKPLGPRDEGDDITGENQFFDQDADRGSFRDVFRRRR